MKETTFLFKVCCWQKKVGDKSFRVKEWSDGSCHYHFNANSGKWLYRPEPNKCKKEFKELCYMCCSFYFAENPVGIMTRVKRKSFFFLNLNKNGHFKLFLHLCPTHEASMNNFDKKKSTHMDYITSTNKNEYRISDKVMPLAIRRKKTVHKNGKTIQLYEKYT